MIHVFVLVDINNEPIDAYLRPDALLAAVGKLFRERILDDAERDPADADKLKLEFNQRSGIVSIHAALDGDPRFVDSAIAYVFDLMDEPVYNPLKVQGVSQHYDY